jgi:hypothetical protein
MCARHAPRIRASRARATMLAVVLLSLANVDAQTCSAGYYLLTNDINRALGRPTASTGAWSSNYESRFVVDGELTNGENIRYFYPADGTIMNWVGIDLQQSYTLTRVRVYFTGYSASSFTIRLGQSSSYTDNPDCATNVDNQPFQDFSCSATGRYAVARGVGASAAKLVT